MRNWRIYRNLAIVYGVALIVWVCEYQRRMKEEDVFVAPESSYTQVISELYPGRSEPEFYQGFRIQLPAETQIADEARHQTPEQFEQSVVELQKKLVVAAEHYQRSIDGGLVSREELLYWHAISLMGLRAEPERIDQAIADWRRNYPYSSRKDLAEVRRAMDANFHLLARHVEEARRRKEMEQQRTDFEKAYGKSIGSPTAPADKP